VLAGLLHRAFVGGDDQKRNIHAARARQHVFHKALVAGDIHNPGFDLAGEGEKRKPEVNGHSPRLLLGKSVGVGARECPDESGLAVIHVSCSADNKMSHSFWYHTRMRQMRVISSLWAMAALTTLTILVVPLTRAQTAPALPVVAQPGWTFVYKKGDVLPYRTYIRFTGRTPDDAGAILLTVRSTSKNTITDVTPEGNIVWEQLDDPGSVAALNDMPLPTPDEIKPVTVTFGQSGLVSKRLNPAADPADQTQKLLPLMGSLPVPPAGVKAGDTWETELPNPMLKNKKLVAKSTLVGNETILGMDCLKVTVTMTFPTAYGLKEDEYMKFSETYWLEAKTRQLVRASYVVKNAVLPFPAKNLEAQAITTRIVPGQNEMSDPEGEAFMKPKPK
jgi:hypothetical protein